MTAEAGGKPVWVRIASRKDLDPEYPIQATIEEYELAVGESDGEVFAIDNICSHAFARLSDGYVQGDQIFCPLHNGSFNVRTGAAVAAPCHEPIARYPTRVEGDDVFVDSTAVDARRIAGAAR